MEITILCKVVDNFGDIGVVYRMARGLRDFKGNKINLVVDDLGSFSKICSSVKENRAFQRVEGLNVYNWNDFDFCYNTFRENDGEKLKIILECFQCGRPDWMEKILFDDKLERTVQIIMIDYLTAEKYAEDFHCLDSLTRSRKVQKINFMPGFTEKTGGLIIGSGWENVGDFGQKKNAGAFIFTYDRNWQGLGEALNEAGIYSKVAQGKGLDSFVEGAKKACYKDFEIMPFMNQEKWDEEMKKASVLFIRGEESMSRACLSGIPFVWHAYPQSDEYQLVKVNALLNRMENHFEPELFSVIRNLWLDVNSPENEVNQAGFKSHCKEFLGKLGEMAPGFEEFARSLIKNGDLCANLMTFINKKVIL